MAPEVPGNQTTKMDVYSYRVMTCELLTEQFPLPDAFPGMLETLCSEWRIMHTLVVGCTKPNPTERSRMADVLGLLFNNFYDVLNQ